MKKPSKSKGIAIAALTAVGSVGLVYAYFQTSDIFNNRFDVAKYAPIIEENFESPSDWTPGTTTPKTVEVTNNGTIPMVVRVSYEEYWKNKNNEDLPLTDKNGNVIAIINFNEDGKWIKKGDHYYYITELAPGETTSSFINSVTFNPDYSLEDAIIATVDEQDENGNKINDIKTITYSTSNNSHVGGSYHLDIKIETMQADQAKAVWDIDLADLNNKVEESLFTYTIANDEVKITGYDAQKGGGDVVIPSSIENLPVTSIGTSAFNNKNLTSVEIPSTVKTIEEKAFYMNMSLNKVVLNEGLESIGTSAFEFALLKQQETLEIPSTVKTIEDWAFHNVYATNLILHEGLETIGAGAFGDSNIGGILEIPSTVKTIGRRAFTPNNKDNSDQLINKLILHEGLERIGEMAFWYQGISGTLEIPSTVKIIEEGAFNNCHQIDSLILHEGLESIERNAFSATNLTSVEIPSTVTSVGSYYQEQLMSPFDSNVTVNRK